jgi:hypothetical protein
LRRRLRLLRSPAPTADRADRGPRRPRTAPTADRGPRRRRLHRSRAAAQQRRPGWHHVSTNSTVLCGAADRITPGAPRPAQCVGHTAGQPITRAEVPRSCVRPEGVALRRTGGIWSRAIDLRGGSWLRSAVTVRRGETSCVATLAGTPERSAGTDQLRRVSARSVSLRHA